MAEEDIYNSKRKYERLIEKINVLKVPPEKGLPEKNTMPMKMQ